MNAEKPPAEARDVLKALRHGLRGRCPQCGEGHLFAGYLAVPERCAACGEPIGDYRTADGPAFFTISIVGLLLVPMLGFGFAVFRPEPLTLLAVVVVAATLLSLVLLRLLKGAFIGYLWAHHERDPGG